MKKVLIALDNHSNYTIISSTGSELANALGASVALLHVFPDMVSVMDSEHLSLYPTLGTIDVAENYKLRDQLEAESKKFLNKVKTEINNEAAEIYTAEGDVGNAILDTATTCKAAIIVMGSHSRSGIDKLLMGNVAKQVIQHSHLPMFIIPIK